MAEMRTLDAPEVAQPRRIQELDGWRGLSALLVVAVHTVAYVFPHLVQTSWVAYHFVRFAGEYSVRIFFFMSGFVIARLMGLEELSSGKISIRAFYLRRIFRILPAFWLLILVTYRCSAIHWTPIEPRTLLQSALFLGDLRTGGGNTFLGHAWTLAVEEQFYLLLPLFWHVTSPRWRPHLLFCLLGLLLCSSVLSEWGILASLPAPSVFVGFACINVGVLVSVIEPRVHSCLVRLPGWIVLAIALIVFIGLTPHGRVGDSLRALYEPFGLALVVMYTVYRENWVSTLLHSRVLQWLGMVSYSIYLWQQIFTGRSTAYGSPAVATAFHTGLPLLFVVAALSFYGIERPCIRLGQRLSQQWKTQPLSKDLTKS